MNTLTSFLFSLSLPFNFPFFMISGTTPFTGSKAFFCFSLSLFPLPLPKVPFYIIKQLCFGRLSELISRFSAESAEFFLFLFVPFLSPNLVWAGHRHREVCQSRWLLYHVGACWCARTYVKNGRKQLPVCTHAANIIGCKWSCQTDEWGPTRLDIYSACVSRAGEILAYGDMYDDNNIESIQPKWMVEVDRNYPFYQYWVREARPVPTLICLNILIK